MSTKKIAESLCDPYLRFEIYVTYLGNYDISFKSALRHPGRLFQITPPASPCLWRNSWTAPNHYQFFRLLTVLRYLCRVGVLVLLCIVICCQVVSMVTLFLSHSQTSLASYGAVVHRSQCRDGMGSSCSAIYAMKTTETELPRSTPTMPVGHEAECEDFFGRWSSCLGPRALRTHYIDL